MQRKIHNPQDMLIRAHRFKVLAGTYPKQKGNTWKWQHFELTQRLGIPAPKCYRNHFNTLGEAWSRADQHAQQETT